MQDQQYYRISPVGKKILHDIANSHGLSIALAFGASLEIALEQQSDEYAKRFGTVAFNTLQNVVFNKEHCNENGTTLE